MASSSSSSPSRPHLPEEMTTEILARLPVKTLLRFKCVSKPWRRLISSPRFVKTHLLFYSPKFPRIMLSSSHRDTHFSASSLFSGRLSVDSINNADFSPKPVMMLVGSCNGLLCLYFRDLLKCDLFLWNPSMRISTQMPLPNVSREPLHQTFEDFRVSDEFQNPTLPGYMWNPSAFGLGYNEPRDDYMVLGIFDNDKKSRQVEIYSLRTNSWRIIGDFKHGVPVYDIACKFVSRKFHLCTRPNETGVPTATTLFDIVSFHIENETYERIEHPDYGGGVERLSLEELGGSLCVLCSKATQADVWVMTEYGDEAIWNKMASVPYFIFSWTPSLYSKPLVIFPSEEILLVFKCRSEVDDCKFAAYDRKHNILRVRGHRGFGEFAKADVYVESLVWSTQDEVPVGQDQ